MGSFWGSLGDLFGALEGLLGDLGGLQIDHKGVTRTESMRLGALDVFRRPRFVILLVLSFVFRFRIRRTSQLKT